MKFLDTVTKNILHAEHLCSVISSVWDAGPMLKHRWAKVLENYIILIFSTCIFKKREDIVHPVVLKGSMCHATVWQIHTFIPKVMIADDI